MSVQGAIVRASAAGLAGVMIAAAVLWTPDSISPAQSDVTLVYIGAEDCAACRAWQRRDGAAFRSSPEFANVAYREVKSPSTLDVLRDEHWPDDLRRYRQHVRRDAGIPLWLVVAGDDIVAQGFGATQWQGVVLPKIRTLLR